MTCRSLAGDARGGVRCLNHRGRETQPGKTLKGVRDLGDGIVGSLWDAYDAG